ncbi:MAG: hypothetical protein A2176_01705 [Spirochaetes bacterium RBG_13_51_14]|nr:MAG: hypothetical protein A2176_01705 [Spirochaetes bacterium RBG_13_51_14]
MIFMKNPKNYIFVLIAILSSAGAFVFSKDQRIFPHKVHIDGSIECVYCHKKINESTSTTGGKEIPYRKICDDCHGGKEGFSATIRLRYHQVYQNNHQFHIKEQGLACKDCHEALYTKEAPSQEESIVKMEYCFQCHDNNTATQYCMLCHVNPTVPDDHLKGWNKLHGKKANAGQKECQKCHTSRESCLRCHRSSKNVARYHNPNYQATHRYESRISLKNCRACHSDRQCRDCHKASGVNFKSPLIQKRHPLGWTNRSSSHFHGRKAKLNLASCTTCHTQNECRYCHFWMKKGLRL